VWNSVGSWAETNQFKAWDNWQQGNATSAPKPKYLRCPSDSHRIEYPHHNYVVSVGPQCAIGHCGTNPFQGWCEPETSNLGGGVAAMGYRWSPDHGNTHSSSDLRGMFNRLGAEINMASVTDGLSNTLMLGESLVAQNDHTSQEGWWHFNQGGFGASTIVPINYYSGDFWNGSNCPTAHNNWNISMGFKSNHSGGANFVFGDGSVRFIRQTIDHRNFQLLGCRNDGQTAIVP
jgi:prepilin-type processing-associated H-X9-DG protein